MIIVIDVIIPMYNCLETIEKTLMSIYIQDIRDKIKVILVDDCSSCDYSSILEKYNSLLNISYFKLENNSGPGVARQYGIDHSNSPYIIFIDSDDLFYTANSISTLYNRIENDYDYVYSLVYDEYSKEFISNIGDLHGKIYRRSFIDSNNIHFNDSKFHEDNLFNSLVLINNPRKSSSQNTTYLYSYNEKSLTKNEIDKEFERLEIYIKNMRYVIDRALENNCKKELIDEYLDTKRTYLNSRYDGFSEEQKDIMNKWLLMYNFDIIK